MALEDFAMFRTIPDAVCFYPSDAVSCERAIELAANHKGVTFTRTTRPKTPVIYDNDTKFEIGKAHVSPRMLFEIFFSVAVFVGVLGCVAVRQ